MIDAGAGDPDAPDWLRRADATLARFLSAHRVASADPGAPDTGRALVVRAGTGTGDQVAAGEWTDAHDLPAEEPPEPKRRWWPALVSVVAFAAGTLFFLYQDRQYADVI